MRSCYSSEWHLFDDQPSLTVPGRYYFSPPGTPFYDGFHLFGARAWADKNWALSQGLGEDIASKQKWNAGELPAIVPLAQVVGSADCIADGEETRNAIPYSELVNGFPPACFVPSSGLVLAWEAASDPTSCSNQFAYAKVIEWIYGENVASIVAFFRAFIGAPAVITFQVGTLTLPSVVVVKTPTYALCIVNGTANYQQLALEALYSIVAPQSWGNFSTNSQWYAASSWILSVMEAAGVSAVNPIFFAGHSYGAAAAAVLSARLRFASSTRQIKSIFFGSPKIGDGRLVNLVSQTQTVFIANDVDYVTALPPDQASLFPVNAVLGIVGLNVWPTWERGPSQILLDVNGDQTFDAYIPLDFATLMQIALDVLGSVPLPAIPSHAITEYAARIFRRCPDAEWPIKPNVYALLTGIEGILLESGEPILVESTGVILLEW